MCLRRNNKRWQDRVTGRPQIKGKRRIRKNGIRSRSSINNPAHKHKHRRILWEDSMDNNRIIKDELVGRNVTIKECTDPNWINVSGKIIDETRNTFLIEIGNQQKRIAKNIAIFEFENNREKTVVEGSRLLYRPEDRIKKAR